MWHFLQSCLLNVTSWNMQFSLLNWVIHNGWFCCCNKQAAIRPVSMCLQNSLLSQTGNIALTSDQWLLMSLGSRSVNGRLFPLTDHFMCWPLNPFVPIAQRLTPTWSLWYWYCGRSESSVGEFYSSRQNKRFGDLLCGGGLQRLEVVKSPLQWLGDVVCWLSFLDSFTSQAGLEVQLLSVVCGLTSFVMWFLYSCGFIFMKYHMYFVLKVNK